MSGTRPTIVCITTHPLLRSMMERHGEHFANIVCLPDIAEFERRVIRLRPRAVLLDEASVPTMMHDVERLRKNPVTKDIRIVTLSERLTHDERVSLLRAGADDILLSFHHTPRDIMARLQTLI